MIFGTNIPDTTCHQMTIQFPTSPNVCFCTIHQMWVFAVAIWLCCTSCLLLQYSLAIAMLIWVRL